MNFFDRCCKSLLGRWKRNRSWHKWTSRVSLVLKSFINNLFIMKSRDLSCDCLIGSTSRPYNKIGIHAPILLYGLECYSLLKADLHCLDFVVMRFLMKLFRTANKDIIDECRSFCNFSLPTETLEIKSNKFCKKIECNKSMLRYFKC